ncbi:unnamed protein product [Zymoseptoria tritici ST99CH_1A5]|uniref:Uncharacterized protein n=3 Tax=Zymoseptoria tritici TaxID=1047171 RepID=F9XA76_ZYMTI|nr:uncharacterized protein MYCGRDRAFT_109115 [Zymoseptoria tritici IPO323]EGP88394.1 hypothetical protein MYCGRDRAFT_109115 [Zymoseptoria tritici IPO323]SMR50920.1 unnamed protein product [Zymoseptoria tritici ST99CH_1E4]SMR51860.1 unnamed protein product [Zymoseptoria tritici ST99CH_3D1]SMY23614.1 unnamed protein product [Zymoseptoria tritici ST99CH_1A5]
MSTRVRELPVEIIGKVLDYIEPQHDTGNDIDRRAFLSVESFDRPPDPSRVSIADIGNFRCASKRFAEIAADRLFGRVACRFSSTGLQKLEQLAQWKHLARHVKRFTYLVPYFYRGGTTQLSQLEDELRRCGFQSSDLQNLHRKAREQVSICSQREDVRILKLAIASFTGLKVIQLLRVADPEDHKLLDYLRHHASDLSLDWTTACSHASQTIGSALLAARNIPWSRFSLPMLSPSSALFLQVNGPDAIPALAERLECLTLHFDDPEALDEKILELSPLFRAVFFRARNMRAIHVGFPSHRPLTLSLETVFHNVVWPNLQAFGVQAWELDEEEIIALVQRHKTKLKGLRLRDVQLKAGSRWKNVLPVLREQVPELRWVSLRRIGYAEFWHTQQGGMQGGTEVPEDLLVSDSDSTEEEDEVADESDGGDEDEALGSDSSSDDAHSDSDEEHGPNANEMEFPPLDSPIATTTPWCTCAGEGRLDSAEELEDNGVQVENSKRKFWERWVVRRCPVHGDRGG